MKKYTVGCAKRLLSLICCAAMLIPALPGVSAADALFRDSFDSYANQAALSAVWQQKGDTTLNVPKLSEDRVCGTSGYSMLVHDTESDKSMQARALVSNKYAKGTELILTTKYYVESLGTSGANPYIQIYGSGPIPSGYTYSTGRWDRLSVVYTTVSSKEQLYVRFISNKATESKVYYDDVVLAELTEALALEYVEEKLYIGGTPELGAIMTTRALGLTDLDMSLLEQYTERLLADRASTGTALTKAQVQNAVDQVNQETRELVNRMAAEVSRSQTLDTMGQIALPAVSDSTVKVEWTGIEGDHNNRILVMDSGPVLNTQPEYNSASETVTMTLTISKGSFSAQVDVVTTIKPYSYNVSRLVEAAALLDISPYLNGQEPDWIVSNLDTLPSRVRLGALNYVTVNWQALNANTLGSTGMMNNAGKVVRGPYETVDTAVILRATLSSLGETYSRDFHFIVPSLGADDARDMLAGNGDFEAAAPTDTTRAPEGWMKHTLWADGPNGIQTDYAAVDPDMAYCGGQSLRITVDENLAKQYEDDKRKSRTISVQNEHNFTAREGYIYVLQGMVRAFKQGVDPSVTLKFLDNEGVVLSQYSRKYSAVMPKTMGVWKNLTVSMCAPAGTVAVVAELNGGTVVGQSWFDDVRLREMPPVANGSFDLGGAGWTTEGSVSGGKLVLSQNEAVSAPRSAARGTAYFLSLQAQGSGTMGLRFLNGEKATIQQYDKTITTGTNSLCAYAPADTKLVSVVLSGSVTVDEVTLLPAPSGTSVPDGDFERSAAGAGTPWELDDAVVGTATGRTGAGLTISGQGSARSAIIPVVDGKTYTFRADMKGAGGVMTVELYQASQTTPDKSFEAVSGSDSWNTVTYTLDPLPACAPGKECAYVRVVLSGKAAFDNVAVYSITDTLSNRSVENINNAGYGSFPYNWSVYGPVVGFAANQAGQSTEGLMGLGVKLFGAGQGGVRSSMVRAEGGLAYEAQAMVKGSGAKLSMEFWSDGFQLLDSRETAINAADWNQASVSGTAPEGTAYVSLSVGGSGVGVAYVDEASLAPVVRTIGSNLQLFLDDWLVGESSGVQRTFQPGEKTAMLVSGGWYGNVVWNPDKGLYEMWHQASGYSLLYRTSADGMNWSEGRKCTSADNIADSGELPSPTVFLDLEERDPARRYKLVCYNYGQGGYDLHFSADGVAFTRYSTILPGSDVITVTYDAVNREYIATHKVMPSNTNTKRTHSIAVSKDLIHWTEGVRMYNIGTQEDILGTDYLRADSYGTSMYALGDSYVGLNWRFLLNENDGYSGKMDVPLMFSRDLTEEWQRMYHADGEVVMAIPRGEEGRWDDAQTYAHSYPIDMGEETWWYYHGWTGDHGTIGVPKTAGIGAVKWRKNGFASLDFGPNGTMTTRQFVLAGTGLRLNAKGALSIELLDASGAKLAAAAFAGDSVDQRLTWDADVSRAVGQPVSLRFTGTDAQLYSLQIESDITVLQAPHGTIAVTPTSGIAGTVVTVTAAADEGYECTAILVDGKPLEGSAFTMESAHTVTARFQPVGAVFYDGMDYPVGGDIYALAPNLYSKTSPAWGSDKYITGTGAGNSGVAVVADPTGADNTCLQVTVENNTTSAKRYILVADPEVSGDYVLEFDYMPSKAASISGSGFVDIYIADGRNSIARLAFKKNENVCRFYSGALSKYIGNALPDPTDSSKGYVFADDTWYSVRITVTADSYTMELWEKGQEATTKSSVSTGSKEGVVANTTTNVEFCFGPYSASQVADLSAPLVNYIDNITITPYNKVTVVQPERGGSIRVDADYARAGQTVRVETEVEPGCRLSGVQVNGTTISGAEFTMPDGPVTVTAVVDTAGQLFYDNMQSYAGDTNIPVGADRNWTGEFGKLGGGTYTRLIRQDEKGNLYLEMTATNTASSTGLARFWLDTIYRYSGSYIVRLDVAVASDPFYVLDLRLPSVKGPDGNEAKLRIRGGDGSRVYFTGSGFASSLRTPEDSSSELHVLEASGSKLILEQGADKWYTLELAVDSTTNTITARVYNGDGQLLGSRALPGCTLAETVIRLDHFASSPKTDLSTTMTKIDNVGVYRFYPVTATADGNGTVSTDRTDGAVGDVVHVSAVPDEGYLLSALIANGEDIMGTGSFTLQPLTGGNAVQATFVPCGHGNKTVVEAVAATCISEGRTAGWSCPDCGAGEASEVTPRDSAVKAGVEPFRTEDGAYTAPAVEEHVFAGWYEDTAYDAAFTGRNGSAYAKFVARDVLRVMKQITVDTTAQSDKTDLRLVTSVDGLNYKQVGFRITFGGRTITVWSGKVYAKIRANDTFQNAADVFHTDARYFMTYTITNIPRAAFAGQFTVVPCWVTLDDTVVDGLGQSFCVADLLAGNGEQSN